MSDLYSTFDSPLCTLLAVGDGRALTRLHMQDARPAHIDAACVHDDEAFASLRTQLDEYFAGRRRQFEVALAPAGTAFERRVWDALLEIPYGATMSYGTIAGRI